MKKLAAAVVATGFLAQVILVVAGADLPDQQTLKPSSRPGPSIHPNSIISVEEGPNGNKPPFSLPGPFTPPPPGYYSPPPPIRHSNPHSLGDIQQPNFLSMQMQSGPTPVIMQYMPQGQIQGGVQYLQLIPTRPLIVPISPYISQMPQHSYAHNSHYPPGSSEPTTRTFTNIQNGPPSPKPVTPGYLPYSATNPVGAYSSKAPLYAYFRPNSGLEIINGPTDLSLNTNEYMPPPSVNSQAAIRPNQ